MKHKGNFLGFCCGPGLRAEALRWGAHKQESQKKEQKKE